MFLLYSFLFGDNANFFYYASYLRGVYILIVFFLELSRHKRKSIMCVFVVLTRFLILYFIYSLTYDQKAFIGQVSFTISAGFINSYQYLEFEKCDASLLFGRKINIEGNHLSLIVLQSVLLLYFPLFSYSKSLKFMCFM